MKYIPKNEELNKEYFTVYLNIFFKLNKLLFFMKYIYINNKITSEIIVVIRYPSGLQNLLINRREFNNKLINPAINVYKVILFSNPLTNNI